MHMLFMFCVCTYIAKNRCKMYYNILLYIRIYVSCLKKLSKMFQKVNNIFSKVKNKK